MIKAGIRTWFLPETTSPDQLIEKISKKFRVQVEVQPKTALTYLDTFDWRLYRKKYLLCQTDRTWTLIRHDSGENVTTVLENSGSPRRFAAEFSEEALKRAMTSIIGVRRLFALVTFDLQGVYLRVFNNDDKTVAHVHINTHKIRADSKTYHTVSLEGVRGYANRTTKLIRFFRQGHITEPVPSAYLFTEGVAAQGRTPGDYSSKFSIQLKATMSTRQAARAIFKRLIKTIRRNEAGIQADIDVEFLHDFRVAIRRTRSGLTQFKGVFPSKITETMKTEMAYLGRITGPTRDLDVYLLFERDYLSRLPGLLGEGLAGFFADMTKRRQREWEKMVKALRSKRYRNIISAWQGYLDSDDHDDPSPHSERPIDEYARKIIYRRYVRILKKGRAIGPSSPDEDLHRLRIQSKKLRYSLEFFASLFPSKEFDHVVKQLKKLQTNLGGFNDLSVQQIMLRDYPTTITPGAKKNLKLAAAIGGLLTILRSQQQVARKQFFTIFKEFSGTQNVRLFSKLFD